MLYPIIHETDSWTETLKKTKTKPILTRKKKPKITLSKPFILKIQDQITWAMFPTISNLKVTLNWYWEYQANELWNFPLWSFQSNLGYEDDWKYFSLKLCFFFLRKEVHFIANIYVYVGPCSITELDVKLPPEYSCSFITRSDRCV